MEHFTRNTVEASVWCGKCGKDTMHRIDGVKRGPCLDCIKRLDLECGIPQPKEPEQMTLMERYGTVYIG